MYVFTSLFCLSPKLETTRDQNTVSSQEILFNMNVSMCLLIAQSPQRLITINETLNTNTTIRENPVEAELDMTSSNSNHRFSKPVS